MISLDNSFQINEKVLTQICVCKQQLILGREMNFVITGLHSVPYEKRITDQNFAVLSNRLIFFPCVFGENFKYAVVTSPSCLKILNLKLISDTAHRLSLCERRENFATSNRSLQSSETTNTALAIDQLRYIKIQKKLK